MFLERGALSLVPCRVCTNLAPPVLCVRPLSLDYVEHDPLRTDGPGATDAVVSCGPHLGWPRKPWLPRLVVVLALSVASSDESARRQSALLTRKPTKD